MTVSPLRNIPLRNIPLRNIDLDASPLRNIPLRNIDMAVSPLRNIPLRNISGVAQLVDCSLVDCASLTATLATAVAASALKPGATLGMLVDALPIDPDTGDIAFELGVLGHLWFGDAVQTFVLGDIAAAFSAAGSDGVTLEALWDVFAKDLAGAYTLGDLAHLADGTAALDLDLYELLFAALTLADLLDILLADPATFGIDANAASALRNSIQDLLIDDLIEALAALEPPVTLADLFLGVLEPEDYPWEELDLAVAADGLRQTTDPDGIPFAVRVTSTLPASRLDLTVDLPVGFSYIPGSLELPNGAITVGEPTLTTDADGSTIVLAHISMPELAPGNSARIVLKALAPLAVGDSDEIFASVSAPDWAIGASTSDGYLLTDRLEDNDAPATATPLGDPADKLVVSYIREAGDVDWFSMTVDQGEKLSLNLSNLPGDYDLLLFGPASSTTLRGEPERTLVPAADNGLSLLGEDAVVAQIPADVDTTAPAGYGFIKGSARRGTDVERIDTGPLAAGVYLVKVTGYNGANSKQPYVLRTRVDGQTVGRECDALPPAGTPLSLGSTVTTIGMTTDTLILVDTARLQRSYGSAAADVVAALQTFTTTLANPPAGSDFGGTRAAAIDLATITAVRNANAAWDADPCDPRRANDVVAAIGHVIDDVITPSIEHVVIVGADDQIPMARLVDNTPAHNEVEYAETWDEANPISASLALGYMLSDDPYSTATPVGVGARQLFLPDLAVGRLVETPDEIVLALANFLSSQGRLDPATAVSTGYDFLEDGARAVAAALDDGLGLDVDDDLISTGVGSWTKADLVEAFAEAGPDIASINAHFDHYRALPADQDARGRLTDPLTTGDVAAAPDVIVGGQPLRPLAGSLIFSMGCHGGLSVSDVVVGSLGSDWAQALAAEGAAGFAANTGYGYGDTETVAFTEELMRLFAERLGQAPTIGAAMAAAKQRYVSELAVISSFEEKVSSQVVFYGLPMYRIDGAEPPVLEPFEVLTPDPVSGIPSVTKQLTPVAQPESTPSGTYYSVGGQVQATPYQPIQPRTSTDVTASGRVARGALVTGLVSQDVPGLIDPVIVTPADDSTGTTVEARSQGAVFPSVLQSVSRVSDIGGERDRLVVVPGQFRGIPGDPAGRGVQRLFTTIDAQVFYAPIGNDDTTPPRISSTRAVVVNGQVAIDVEVPDDDAVRVLALYVESDATGTRTWKPLELTSTDRHSWVGTAPAATGATEIDYFIQVLDSGGNVSVSSDKGSNFTASVAPPAPEPEPGAPTIALDPPAPPNGTVYTGSVAVTAAPAADGEDVELVVNGATSTNPVVLTDSGVYTVTAITPGRPAVTTTFVIDATGTPPAVSASTDPAPNGTNGWHTTKPVEVEITGQAGTRPVAAIVYSLNNGAERTVSGASATVTLDADGEHLVAFRAVDSTGVSSLVAMVEVKIDTVPPVVVCPSAPTFLLNQPGTSFQAVVSGATVSAVTLDAPTDVVGSRVATAPAVADQAGNSTPVACPYNVRYRVEGFDEPITMHTVNKANAGKNIPVKWRLTDYNGQGVSSAASFVGISLSPGGNGCSSQSSEAIDTYTPLADSAPKYQNDGNWHLNWKTDKSLKGCRIMMVGFADGSRLTATFDFS